MMVVLKFFIDEDKSVDWIVGLETRLRRVGSIRGFEIVLSYHHHHDLPIFA